MKQGTNYIMRVNLDFDFDTIEKIDFIFEQGDARLKFTYPSAKAQKVEGEKAVNLVWTYNDTYIFKAYSQITMDTRISLIDVDTNPETSLAKFYMNPTLFTKGDIEDGN